MAIEVTVPRLGWSMDEGTLVEWLKCEGDRVRSGDPLFVLESEKAAQEIESLDEGVLWLAPDGPKPGDTVKVGQLLGWLLSDEEAAAGISPAPQPVEPAVARPASRRPPCARFDPPHLPQGPAARRQARREGRGTATTEPGQPIVARDVRSKPRASPRARRKAAELNIDPHLLEGLGRSGRIRERDVLAAAQSRGTASDSSGVSPTESSAQQVPHTPLRRTIAERMLASHQTMAPVTLTSTVDATELVALRRQFRDALANADDLVPSYADFVVKLTALVLREHPALNACWRADHVLQFADVHMGIAVDTDAGLVVPVIRDAGTIGLRAIARQARELEDRARRRQLTAAEMQGGTFTLSNLGAIGVDAFTPIINPPQCAILGMGRIAKRPWVVDGQLVARDIMTLSLTFDHRAIDGGPAARFLQELCRAIERPAARLID